MGVVFLYFCILSSYYSCQQLVAAVVRLCGSQVPAMFCFASTYARATSFTTSLSAFPPVPAQFSPSLSYLFPLLPWGSQQNLNTGIFREMERMDIGFPHHRASQMQAMGVRLPTAGGHGVPGRGSTLRHMLN